MKSQSDKHAYQIRDLEICHHDKHKLRANTQIQQKTVTKLHFPVIIMSTQQNIDEENQFKDINQLKEQKRKTQTTTTKTSFVPSAETHGNCEKGARRWKWRNERE